MSESVIRFLKAVGDPTVIVDYTNYRGIRELRHITPLWIEWVEPGFNKYHPEGGFMLACWCHRAKAQRAFRLKDIHRWGVDLKEFEAAQG